MRKNKSGPTPGHKAVLVSDDAFLLLKQLQRREDGDALPLTFDLKEIATALVLEAEALPNLRDRVRQRALTVMNDMLSPATAIQSRNQEQT